MDHVNLLAKDVSVFRDFMITCFESRVTEQILLDNGRLGGCWFTVNNKSYDLACTEEHAGGQGRFHHVTYVTDQRDEIIRAADIFLENGIHIETGPHKHAIQGTFFLYVFEPAGNRVEIANQGSRLILQPDWEPIVWTESERKKGQAWGLKTTETFHTYGNSSSRSKTDWEKGLISQIPTFCRMESALYNILKIHRFAAGLLNRDIDIPFVRFITIHNQFLMDMTMNVTLGPIVE